MSESPLDAARVWVGEQLRYPQRLPRTSIVLDWSEVPSALQRRLEEVARTSESIDYGALPRRRWFSSTPALSRSERQVVVAAASTLEWPLHLDCDETRLVTVAEGVIERTISHQVWSQPALGGRRSVIAQHMELHAIAAAANELLILRSSTPVRPAANSLVHAAHSREEWNRRQVVFARSRAALVDRVAALRVVEDALDRVQAVAEELRTVQLLSVDADLAGTLFRDVTAAQLAAATAHANTADLEAAEANLRSQIAYLDDLVPRPAQSSNPWSRMKKAPAQ